ncbi:MAG: hypothetical protein ABI867_22160 [Kofleriaceae bacterium]
MRCLIVAVVCALVSDAVADDKANVAAARKLVELGLNGPLDDAPDTAKNFVGVTPGHLYDGDLMGWRFGPPYIGRVKIVASTAGWSGSWGWIVADLAVPQRAYTPSDGGTAKEVPHRYHLVQVFVGDGKDIKVQASMIADTQSDDKLPAVTPSPGGPPKSGTLAYYLVTPHEITLAAKAEVAVVGSSQGEVAIGPVAAKKLLASWSKLGLGMSGVSKEVLVGDLGIVVSEVELLVGKKVVRLRGMIVGRKKGAGWEVVALAYGADSQSGDPKTP